MTGRFITMKRIVYLLLGTLLILAGCDAQSDAPVLDVSPTVTFQPIVSQTPRATSTVAPTRTPLPTFTFTPTATTPAPTATDTPTPTMTPTVVGIIQSAANRVNVREAPDVNSSAITSLVPGTGVEVIGQNTEGTWRNIRLEDGREGWISSRLLFVQPSATPFPSATPSPDLTALFLGTPLPTAILGGGTITPTPPNQVRTDTPEEETEIAVIPTQSNNIVGGVPVIDNNSIYATATALAGGVFVPPSANETEDPSRVITVVPDDEAPANTTPNTTPATATLVVPTPTVDINEVDGRDVFAYCDDANFGYNPPTTLREGEYIDIWWGWIARTEEQIEDHIDAVTYDLRVNGDPIENVNRYVGEIEPLGGRFIAYWYVPYGPLVAGDYEITYLSTWERAIFDGNFNYGPGTDIPFEQQTCSFTVR